MKHLFFKKWLALFMIATFLFGGSFFNVALAEELSQPIITETPAVETSATEVTQTVEPTALTPISEPEIIAPTTEVVTPAVTETTVEITKTETADSTQAILEPEVIPAVENTAPVVTESIPETTAIEEIIATEIAATPIVVPTLPKEIWTNSGSKATTNNPVELNTTYTAPQNDQVTVTFTKLPETPGILSIEEITLTPEQVTSLGALSDKAYDITSDMTDGSFAFDLTLPKPVNKDNVQIKFAEDVAGLKNADTVATSDLTTESDSVSASLDHFTIFVVVYDALPSVSNTNYPSLGFQATQTSEFGDYVHLSGTTRLLNTVTVTMSDWAKYSEYSSDERYSNNSTSWSHPVTINIYGAELNSNGTPKTTLGTITKDIIIPWRPENSSECGTAWKSTDGNCYNGLAFNAVFDMSSLNLTLPNDVIVGVAYDTNSWGNQPIGLNGPYESLNVAIPNNQPITIGSDDSVNEVFWNTVTKNWYTDGGAAGYDIFRKDTNWSPNGTVAFKIDTIGTTPICNASSFDTFNLGSVNNQGGWSISGSYDQAVVDNIYGYPGFGCKSLRLSDSITSNSFGDQMFANPEVNGAGEKSATAGTFSIGTRQNHFESQFDIASTMLTQQPGLHLSVSPDRGDGSRMSFLRFEDNTNGIDVFFYDVQGVGSPANFVETKIGTLDRTIPHTVKFVMDFLDGPSNDVVKVYIDGNLAYTGTSWENYYRYDNEASSEQSTRIVKTVLFRQSGTATPADAGNGFLLDNFSTSAAIVNPAPITNSATNITILDTTLNGSNGTFNAEGHSFWVSTSTFETTSPNIPTGVYSTPDLGFIGSNENFSATLSSITTNGVPTHLPVITPNTTYYFAAWSLVDGTWYPGEIKTFTTAPSVPTNGTPNNSYEKTNDFYFNWDTSDNGIVTYEFQSSLNPTQSNGVLTNGIWKSGILTSNTIHSVGAPDGTWYWQVRAINSVGDKSAWSPIWKMTIDSKVPIVAITTPFVNQVLKGRTITINGTATDSDFNYYYCYITNANGEIGTRDAKCETAWWAGAPFRTAFAETANGTTNSNLGTISFSNSLPDGNYVAHLVAKDKAGNSAEVTQSFILDNTKSTLSFVTPESFSTPFNVGPNVEVKAFDTNGLSVLNIHVFNNLNILLSNSCSAKSVDLSNGNLNCNLSNLPDGTYYIKSGVNDKAGNNKTISSGYFIIDSSAPTARLIFPLAGPSAKSFQVVFSEDVNAEDATNPANYFLNNWPGAGGSGDLFGDANITYDAASKIATVNFINPDWSISAEQQWGVQNIHDLAGNLQDPSLVADYSTEMKAPVTTATLEGIKGLNDVYASSVTINLTADDGDLTIGSGVKSTYYSIDGAEFTVGKSIVVETDGDHTIRYYSEDNAGNNEVEKNITFKINATLAGAQKAAKDALMAALATYSSTDYTTENWAFLNGFSADGIAAIDAAKTVDEVTLAQKNAIDGMAGVEKIIKTFESVVLSPGNGYTPNTLCSSVTYGEWGNSNNGIQYRDVLSQTPNNCSLTDSQQLERSRDINKVTSVTQQVLGVKVYANGTLLKGGNNRIYVVIDNKLQYISSLRELIKYRGPILKVSDEVIASFLYTDGTLIRAKGDNKIYVIKDGKKVHIKSLAELRKYKGSIIVISVDELSNY